MDVDPEDVHLIAWSIAGVFSLCSSTLSFGLVVQHAQHTPSEIRKYIIRILLMIPIYAMVAWIGLKWPSCARYLDAIRQAYEAFVIYSFFSFLVCYLGGQDVLIKRLERKPHRPHFFPLCFLPDWEMGEQFFSWVRIGTLQFVVLKPLVAVAEFAFQTKGEYETGNFAWNQPYAYLSFIQNCSQVLAMYSLIIFYLVMSDDLRPLRPIPKFLCIKLVVFFTFWQGLTLSMLVHVQIIRETAEFTAANVETGLQDFLICVEMFFFSVAHLYAFPVSDFDEDNETHAAYVSSRPRYVRTKSGVMNAIYKAVDIRDVASDVKDVVRTAKKLRKSHKHHKLHGKRDEESGSGADAAQPPSSPGSQSTASSAPGDVAHHYDHNDHNDYNDYDNDDEREPSTPTVPTAPISLASPSAGAAATPSASASTSRSAGDGHGHDRSTKSTVPRSQTRSNGPNSPNSPNGPHTPSSESTRLLPPSRSAHAAHLHSSSDERGHSGYVSAYGSTNR